MGKKRDVYTVVVLPSPTSEPYRFTLRKNILKTLIGFSSVFVLLLVVFFARYFLMLDQLTDLKDLRRETKAQKIQIQSFVGTIDDLKKQMTRLVEFDRKLRVITDIGLGQEHKRSLGRGGPEEEDTSDLAVGSDSISRITSAIRSDLGELRKKSIRQEKSFQELSEAVRSRQSLWASTPSIWPTDGWISSTFGKRISPFTGRLQRHKGIDISARPGTPVIAPAGGVISYSRFNGGYGKFLKLNHGYGYITHYGHLSKAVVKVGQKVKRGEIIGYVGNTGLSTGPHLHYEVFVNSIPVNPMKYILN
jgi:murein DD-endopeptidase MepM/ murein hydrolase activator NlpD